MLVLKVQWWTHFSLTSTYIFGCYKLIFLSSFYDLETDLGKLNDLSKLKQVAGIRTGI